MKRPGEVVAIKNLFAKYKKTLQAPQKTVELEVILIVGELLNLTLREDQVSYTPATRVLFINASSLLKQRLKQQEKEILTLLASRLGAKSTPKTML